MGWAPRLRSSAMSGHGCCRGLSGRGIGAGLLVRLAALGCGGSRESAAARAAPAGGGAAPAASVRRLYDITGVIGSGQSLSIGAQAADVANTTQPFSNL